MKIIERIAILALVLVASVSCDWLHNTKEYYFNLEMTPESSVMHIGETLDLHVNFIYYDSENPDKTYSQSDFRFSSSDPKVATVYNGVVTAVGLGQCRITLDIKNEFTTYSLIEVVEGEPEGEAEE